MTAHNALIIDDEPDIRELLQLTLSRMDIETHSAESLKQASKLITSQAFDLCITDMNLPDGNGIEMVKFISDYRNNCKKKLDLR